MISTKQIAKLLLALAAGAAYLGMCHLAATADHPPLAAIFLSIAPLGIIALVSAWHSRLRVWALSLFVICALALALNLDKLQNHAAWFYFAQHAGAMILLGIMFGSTLGKEHADALCSRIASFVLPYTLDAAYLEYTWRVTLAWAIFFALSALTSILLFFFGPIEIWSVFANLLTPLLLGAMFVGEYLIRLRAIPNRPHVNITETINAYREYSRRQNPR